MKLRRPSDSAAEQEAFATALRGFAPHSYEDRLCANFEAKHGTAEQLKALKEVSTLLEQVFVKPEE